MALIGPVLDDRTWQQLRDELVHRIPTYNPMWTDHNPSDPGIALLELFASLGESLLFRFNQIPEATRIAFLRLLGVEPRPAQAASVLTVFTTEWAGGARVPARTTLAAGEVEFETDDEVYAWPLEVLGAGRFLLPADSTDSDAASRRERGRRDDARARLELTAEDPVRFYETRLLPERIDAKSMVDRALWVALRRTDTADVEQMEGRSVFLAVGFEETIPRPFTLDALGAADAYRSDGLDTAPPPVLWRIWVPGTEADGDTLCPLQVPRDRTRGMTTSGTVMLNLPRDLTAIAAATETALEDGRAVGPGTDGPPDLDDDGQRGSVIAWIQAARPSTAAAQAIPPVVTLDVNAAWATQLSTATTAELLGSGDGQPNQPFALVHGNVVAGSVELEVEEAGVWTRWDEVEDFVATRAVDDRHYAVDLADGTVRFAAGGRDGGRVPQIGERIRVLSYRHGGGGAGNVPKGALQGSVNGADGTNPAAAAGGKDAEPIGDALDRIPAEVHRRDRAVTEDDFVALAESVAGVSRAHAIGLFHPDTPAVRAAGVISVIVVPDTDAEHPGAPLPDRSLLRRVARHLDRRRLVTTELYVIPPEYVRIAVSVGVEVRDGYQVDAVRRWVELIVRQFLAPVPPYGPDGAGWPFGRPVLAAELAAVAVQVEGVAFVQGLHLATEVAGSWSTADRVDLARHQIPELAVITVVQGTPPPPGEGEAPLPPEDLPAGTVLVPLPREVC